MEVIRDPLSWRQCDFNLAKRSMATPDPLKFQLTILRFRICKSLLSRIIRTRYIIWLFFSGYCCEVRAIRLAYSCRRRRVRGRSELVARHNHDILCCKLELSHPAGSAHTASSLFNVASTSSPMSSPLAVCGKVPFRRSLSALMVSWTSSKAARFSCSIAAIWASRLSQASSMLA